MKLSILACVAGGLLASLPLHAHIGPLDLSFGDAGMRSYAFQPVAGANHDRAIVACPMTDGTLMVMGTASDQRRIVTVRLLPDGDHDARFSTDGKESFDLPATYTEFVPGLCQPDGHMVAARPLTATGGEQSLQVFRVLKHTGLLDPGFGSAGVVALDLDQWLPGLALTESPLGVNALANGDIAVSGYATLAAGGERGFVALLAANGAVRAVALLGNVASRQVTTVVDAPDGRLWAFGMNGRINGAYRATLNRNSLAWEGVLEYAAPAGRSVWVGAGRAVDAETVVLASSTGPSPAYDGWPQLIVFRAGQVSVRSLPMPGLDGEQLAINANFGAHGVAVLPQRRVLFAAAAHRYGGAGGTVGIHLAVALIGSTPQDDLIDDGFPVSGTPTTAFRPAAPACATQLPGHEFARLTSWLGRPVLVGSVAAPCLGNGQGLDYLVMRVQIDALFADDFD